MIKDTEPKDKTAADSATDSGKGYALYTEPADGQIHRVYLHGSISLTRDYTGLFQMLETATMMDEVTIHISGVGGNVDTCMQLINHIQSSEANVTMNVVGSVYSAHAFLAFAGDHIDIKDNVFFLFHDVSWGGPPDKNSAILHEARFYKLFYKKFEDRLLGHVLTQKELKDMRSGKEVYIEGDDIKQRLKELKDGQV